MPNKVFSCLYKVFFLILSLVFNTCLVKLKMLVKSTTLLWCSHAHYIIGVFLIYRYHSIFGIVLHQIKCWAFFPARNEPLFVNGKYIYTIHMEGRLFYPHSSLPPPATHTLTPFLYCYSWRENFSMEMRTAIFCDSFLFLTILFYFFHNLLSSLLYCLSFFLSRY